MTCQLLGRRSLSILIYGDKIQRQMQTIQKVQTAVEFQPARCMDTILEIFTLTRLHCYVAFPLPPVAQVNSAEFQMFRRGGNNRVTSRRIWKFPKSAEMPGMSARVHAHFTRSELSSYQMAHAGVVAHSSPSELSSYQMAHAGGPRTRDHTAQAQTARQWRS